MMPGHTTPIKFHLPQTEGNRIVLSWDPHPLLRENSCWIEYQDIPLIRFDPETLTEAYLPICLAFSALGDLTVDLPAPLHPEVLQSWKKICLDTSRVLFKKESHLEFVMPSIASSSEERPQKVKETALLFGGGSESLLTLAHLLDQGTRPLLISLWGENWHGSDPALNPERFTLEEGLCKEFGLKIIRIHTNIRDIFEHKRFIPYMRQDIFIINAALFLPISIALVLPISRALHIENIVSGNEQENAAGIHFYSFCPEMTKNLQTPGKRMQYTSLLEDMSKAKILQQLHTRYPALAKYQYSCWRSIKQRWCLNCEKCLRNYIGYKIFDIDPEAVGMDEKELKNNFPSIIRNVKKECRQYSFRTMGWEALKYEAARQNKPDIVHLIHSFYPLSSRLRIFWNHMLYRFNKTQCPDYSNENPDDQ